MQSQKQLILEIVRSAREHLTADEIYLEAKRRRASVAMGTVYRNLGILVAEGAVRRVEMAGQLMRFDKTLRPHEHMVCRGCGHVEDVELGFDLLSHLRRCADASVESYQLSITYTCPACRAAAGGPPEPSQGEQDEKSGICN